MATDDLNSMGTHRIRRLAVVAALVGSLAAGSALGACGSDDGGTAAPTLSAAGLRGQTVAKDQGCTSCHTADGGRSSGPTWEDLAGSTVRLDDGSTVEADDDYLRRAILQSKDELVEGFPPIMPVYEDQLTDAEVDDLIAYLRDLSSETGTTTTAP